jgi:hypothetical protein
LSGHRLGDDQWFGPRQPDGRFRGSFETVVRRGRWAVHVTLLARRPGDSFDMASSREITKADAMLAERLAGSVLDRAR